MIAYLKLNTVIARNVFVSLAYNMYDERYAD